jgi:hypothetical protein
LERLPEINAPPNDSTIATPTRPISSAADANQTARPEWQLHEIDIKQVVRLFLIRKIFGREKSERMMPYMTMICTPHRRII